VGSERGMRGLGDSGHASRSCLWVVHAWRVVESSEEDRVSHVENKREPLTRPSPFMNRAQRHRHPNSHLAPTHFPFATETTSSLAM
jgi:hypothetical protein